LHNLCKYQKKIFLLGYYLYRPICGHFTARCYA